MSGRERLGMMTGLLPVATLCSDILHERFSLDIFMAERDFFTFAMRCFLLKLSFFDFGPIRLLDIDGPITCFDDMGEMNERMTYLIE